MSTSTRITYLFSGMLLANAMPHLIVAVTGRRNMTPFGRDSSPALNALWAAINVAGSWVLVTRADRRTVVQRDAEVWLPLLLAGSVIWSVFMFLYEWFTRSR